MQPTARARARHHAQGFALLEVLIGILLASLVIGAGVSAVTRAVSASKAPRATDDGQQTAENVATEIEALAAYDPSLLQSMRSGATFTVKPSYAAHAKATSSVPIVITVTGVTQPPKDGFTRSLGTVSIAFTADGKLQSANIPIAAIAPEAERHCNPAAGETADCIVK